MKPESLALLDDVERACDRIQQYTADMGIDAWCGDEKTQDAVERNFDRIGEALNRLRRRDPDLAKRVPSIQGIIDFRNLLTHGYDVVDVVEVWGIVEEHLPGLRLTVNALKTELESTSVMSREPSAESDGSSFGPS